MDDCKELEQELDDLNVWYRWEIIFCIIKALFALFGMDWLVDVLRGRKSFGEAFGKLEAFLVVLLTLDIVAVINWIRNTLPELLDKLPIGKAIKQQLKKLLGPVALILLIVDVAFAVKGFFDCRKIAQTAFNNRVKEIYEFYTCENKDEVLKSKGIQKPSGN